jgi:hypothetical protein
MVSVTSAMQKIHPSNAVVAGKLPVVRVVVAAVNQTKA